RSPSPTARSFEAAAIPTVIFFKKSPPCSYCVRTRRNGREMFIARKPISAISTTATTRTKPSWFFEVFVFMRSPSGDHPPAINECLLERAPLRTCHQIAGDPETASGIPAAPATVPEELPAPGGELPSRAVPYST